MAHTTLTLSANGRLPQDLSGTPSASTDVVIASGIIGLVASNFACNLLSCLGLDTKLGIDGKPGAIGIFKNKRYRITQSAAGTQQFFVSVGSVERVAGTTLTVKGAGTY